MKSNFKPMYLTVAALLLASGLATAAPQPLPADWEGHLPDQIAVECAAHMYALSLYASDDKTSSNERVLRMLSIHTLWTDRLAPSLQTEQYAQPAIKKALMKMKSDAVEAETRTLYCTETVVSTLLGFTKEQKEALRARANLAYDKLLSSKARERKNLSVLDLTK